MKLILYHANAMMKEIAENWAKENQIEVTVSERDGRRSDEKIWI